LSARYVGVKRGGCRLATTKAANPTNLCLRFTLSYRDVEEVLAERGLDISYETARCWVLKLGPTIARRLRRALGTRPPYKSSQTLRWMKPDSNFSSLSGSVPLRASGAVLLGTLRRSRRRGRMPAV